MRYFFDVDDDQRLIRDPDGHEFETREGMRDAAVAALPDIARDELPNGSRRVFTVKVRDETGRYVYQATLSFIGTWLD
jgi:hypothetical protein